MENKSLKKNFIIATSIAVVTSIIAIVFIFLYFASPYKTITKKEFLKAMGGVQNVEIPIVEITTQGYQAPYNKEDYINCSFKMYNSNIEEDNFEITMKKQYDDEDSVGIRLRGNSTKLAPKKPYRIKFENKQSFFTLKDAKNWVLLADFYDQSKIRNYTAFTLAKSFKNMNFSPTGNHVVLILNDEFKGIYLMCEQMEEKKGRTNIEEDIVHNTKAEYPFLVELDTFAYREGVTGVDNFTIENFSPVEIKYPKSDERELDKTEGDPVFNYIKEYLTAVAYLVKNGGTTTVSFREKPVTLTDLINIESAVDYYLINEIMLNFDSCEKSIYLHKSANTLNKDGSVKKYGKIEFGPIWDFDFSLSQTFQFGRYTKSDIETAKNIHIAKNSIFFKHLIQDESFYNAVCLRFDEIKQAIIKTSEHLKNYKNTIYNAASYDAQCWYGKSGEFEFGMQYDYVRLYLIDRYNYLDTYYNLTHSEILSLIGL